MKTYADYGINIQAGANGNVRAICPECTPHRKNANKNEKDLSVNVDEGVWNCHHCGWSGNLQGVGEKKSHVVRYEPNLDEIVVSYMKEHRGISRETLIAHSIGYQPGKNGLPYAIMFPRYRNGLCVAVKFRGKNKNMWQSKNPMPCFYNYDNAVKAGGEILLICEGEIDSLSWTEAGVLANVSVPNGAPSTDSKKFDSAFKFLEDGLIEKFSTFILAVDNDEAGQFLQSELAKRIGQHRCMTVKYPDGCKDANDVLKKHGPETLRFVSANARPLPIAGLYTSTDMSESVMDLYYGGLKPGLSTGYLNLDEYYTIRESEMTIITGMPGSGKSTWLDALTVNLNRLHGWKFAYCSPENWPVQRHIASIVEKMSLKPFGRSTQFFDGMSMQFVEKINEDELRRCLEDMRDSFFFTQLQDDDMNIESILQVMKSAIDRHGVNGIVLDPWNELEHHRPANISETEFISSALGKIRRFARLNGVHVWIVAHPTKLRKNDSGDYPVPRLYDIAGSAHFYNKADNGISIHRANLKSNVVEVHVQKIRFKEIGKPGMCNLEFFLSNGTYRPADIQNQNCNSNAPF